MKPDEAKQLTFGNLLTLDFEKRGTQIESIFICPTSSPAMVLIAVYKTEWETLSAESSLHKLRPIEDFSAYVSKELMKEVKEELSLHWAYTFISVKHIEPYYPINNTIKSLDNILTELEDDIRRN